MRRVNVNSFFWTVAAFLFAYMNDAKGIPEGSQRSVAMKKISLSPVFMVLDQLKSWDHRTWSEKAKCIRICFWHEIGRLSFLLFNWLIPVVKLRLTPVWTLRVFGFSYLRSREVRSEWLEIHSSTIHLSRWPHKSIWANLAQVPIPRADRVKRKPACACKRGNFELACWLFTVDVGYHVTTT